MADDNQKPQTQNPQEQEPQQIERPPADPDLSDFHKKTQDSSKVIKRQF